MEELSFPMSQALDGPMEQGYRYSWKQEVYLSKDAGNGRRQWGINFHCRWGLKAETLVKRATLVNKVPGK